MTPLGKIISKRRRESSPGFLISIDATPYYQQTALQILTEYKLVQIAGILPKWHKAHTDRNNSLPYFPYEGDIDTFVFSQLNIWYDARFNRPSPNVDIILGGPVTAVAWLNYWQDWEKITNPKNEMYTNEIKLATETGQPADKEYLILLSPQLVYSTWPGTKPPQSVRCLPYPDQIGSLNHHLLQSSSDQRRHPNLEILDYSSSDGNVGSHEIDDIHDQISLGILAMVLDNFVRF